MKNFKLLILLSSLFCTLQLLGQEADESKATSEEVNTNETTTEVSKEEKADTNENKDEASPRVPSEESQNTQETKEDIKETSPKEKEKIDSDYIQDLSSKDSYLQIKACEYLSSKKDTSALPALKELVENETADVSARISSVKALVLISEEKEDLGEFLIKITDTSSIVAPVRYATFISVVELKLENQKKKIQSLVTKMETNQDPYIKDLALKLKKNYELSEGGTSTNETPSQVESSPTTTETEIISKPESKEKKNTSDEAEEVEKEELKEKDN